MKKMINEIEGLVFTRRAFLDFAQFEELKQDIEAVAKEVVKFCEDNEIVNLVNRIYSDDYEAVNELAMQMRLDVEEDCGNKVANETYDILIENQFLYEAENGLIFDFRIENSENDDFMDLNDAMAFLRWQMDLKVDEESNQVEEMLDQLFSVECWNEIENFQGKYAEFWFDAIKDTDGRIKFNMDINGDEE